MHWQVQRLVQCNPVYKDVHLQLVYILLDLNILQYTCLCSFWKCHPNGKPSILSIINLSPLIWCRNVLSWEVAACDPYSDKMLASHLVTVHPFKTRKNKNANLHHITYLASLASSPDFYFFPYITLIRCLPHMLQHLMLTYINVPG